LLSSQKAATFGLRGILHSIRQHHRAKVQSSLGANVMTSGWNRSRMAMTGVVLLSLVLRVCESAQASEALERVVAEYLASGKMADYERAVAELRRHPERPFSGCVAVVKRVMLASISKTTSPGAAVCVLPSGPGPSLGRYAVRIPTGYDPGKKHPLILALAGGPGDGEKYLPSWERLTANTDFIVACPVAGGTMWWKTAYLIALETLADCKRRYNVDTNRVCVTGVSNGGMGAWFMAVNFPDLFAAAGSIAGAPVTRTDQSVDPGYLVNLLNLPIYFVHGENDTTIPAKYDRRASEILKEAGYDFVYEEVHGGGHGVPAAYTQKLLDWLVKRTRNPNPQRVKFRKRMAEPRTCYWLHLGKTRRDSFVEAQISNQSEIAIRATNVQQMTLYLSDALVDFDKEISVRVNDRVAFTGRRKPRPEVALKTAKLFEDTERIYGDELAVSLQAE